jgi:hypothetical protein
VRYPSVAFPTRDDQVIVADFSKAGRIVIFDPQTGKVSWEYHARSDARHPPPLPPVQNTHARQRHRIPRLRRARTALPGEGLLRHAVSLVGARKQREFQRFGGKRQPKAVLTVRV